MSTVFPTAFHYDFMKSLWKEITVKESLPKLKNRQHLGRAPFRTLFKNGSRATRLHMPILNLYSNEGLLIDSKAWDYRIPLFWSPSSSLQQIWGFAAWKTDMIDSEECPGKHIQTNKMEINPKTQFESTCTTKVTLILMRASQTRHSNFQSAPSDGGLYFAQWLHLPCCKKYKIIQSINDFWNHLMSEYDSWSQTFTH